MKKVKLLFITIILIFYYPVNINAQTPVTFLNTQQIGGTNDEYITDLQSDNIGNIYYVFNTLSDEVFLEDSLLSNNDSHLLKFNPQGELLFDFGLGISNNNYNVYLTNILILNDYNILINGMFKDSLMFGDTVYYVDNFKGFICKIDQFGNPLNFKIFEAADVLVASDFANDFDNNIYLVGYGNNSYYVTPDNDTIYSNIYSVHEMLIWKYDVDFNYKWLIMIDSDHHVFGKDIEVNSENNLICGGIFIGTEFYYNNDTILFNNDQHILFSEISKDGEIIWVNFAEAEGQIDVSANDLTCDNENNIYFTTKFNFPITYDGVTFSTNNNGSETLILKISTNGNYLWHQKVYCPVMQPIGVEPATIKAKDDFIYLSGRYQSTLVLGNITLPKINNIYYLFDSFLTQIDKNTGNFIWASGFYNKVSLMDDNVCNFCFGPDEIMFFSGPFTDHANYGNQNFSSFGEADLFFAKIQITYVGEPEKQIEFYQHIFPNPSSSLIFSDDFINADIFIFNNMGSEILSFYNYSKNKINLNNLKHGIYIIKVNKHGNTFSEKIILK